MKHPRTLAILEILGKEESLCRLRFSLENVSACIG
jgi:hypothetical protein